MVARKNSKEPKKTKAKIAEEILESRQKAIANLLHEQLSQETAESLAKQIVRGASGGAEFGENDFEAWLSDRFMLQLVWLDTDDYTRAITRALPQALKFAAADFGSSRQRDLGQLWTDTARGFLGEIAFQRFLKNRFDCTIEPDLSMDKSKQEYITTDIKEVLDENTGIMRSPKINVSIKTGKFNSRWMDEYSASKTIAIDAFVFVRVGTAREHFISFLKSISFLETKLFPEAERLGEIDRQTKTEILNSIPNFEPVPAYIAGYLSRASLNLPVHSVQARLVKGKSKKIKILQGVGNFTLENLRADERIRAIDPDFDRLNLIIDGLDKNIDNNPHFYANTGALSFGVENWRRFVESL